jgi:hypothetical protein
LKETATARKLRIKQAQSLQIYDTDNMPDVMMNFAMALFLKKECKMEDSEVYLKVFVDEKAEWNLFNPMWDGEDLITVISQVELVLGTHPLRNDKRNPDKITGYYHSCHGFFSETKCDYARTVGQAVGTVCAKLLRFNLKYDDDWKEK